MTDDFVALISAYFYLEADNHPGSILLAEQMDGMAMTIDTVPAAAPTAMAARIVSAAWQSGVTELFPEARAAATSARWRAMAALVSEARALVRERALKQVS